VLQDCAVSTDNPDTCGVCSKHFADCEKATRATLDEQDRITVEEPSCPGARARALLQSR
jgi:hypothetical protein